MSLYVNTPIGPIKAPTEISSKYTAMSDTDLMQEYVRICRDFVDPFLYQALADRHLIRQGETWRHVAERLEYARLNEREEINHE